MLFMRWNLPRINLFYGLPFQESAWPPNRFLLADLIFVNLSFFIDSVEVVFGKRVSFKTCAIGIIQVIIWSRWNIVDVEYLVYRRGSTLVVILLILFHSLPWISKGLSIEANQIAWLYLHIVRLFAIVNILRSFFICIRVVDEFTAQVWISRVTVHNLTVPYRNLLRPTYYSCIIFLIIKNTPCIMIIFLDFVHAIRMYDNRVHADLGVVDGCLV